MRTKHKEAGGQREVEGSRGEGEEVEGGEEGGDGAKKKEIKKKKNCHKDGTYVNIPTTKSLGPRLKWAQIWSQHLGSICGYWTRPIWGLKIQCFACQTANTFWRKFLAGVSSSAG